MDARHEKLEKYYIEKPSRDKTASHQLLMKTITLWMAQTLAKQYKKISFQPRIKNCMFFIMIILMNQSG